MHPDGQTSTGQACSLRDAKVVYSRLGHDCYSLLQLNVKVQVQSWFLRILKHVFIAKMTNVPKNIFHFPSLCAERVCEMLNTKSIVLNTIVLYNR